MYARLLLLTIFVSLHAYGMDDKKQEKKTYEAFKKMLNNLPIDVQKHIYTYAIHALNERNKKEINKLIQWRVSNTYKGIEHKAWRKSSAECVHSLEFNAGDCIFNLKPFCAAFLHTRDQSYLFAQSKTEPYRVVELTTALFKKETIYLERIFPDLQGLPIIEQHWTKPTTRAMGNIGIRAVRSGGTIAYSFRSISDEEKRESSKRR
jgi:hypothetical protein